jgi:hypothetical protein
MTTDRYTKAVLTIIAAALLYIGAMLSGQPASAQGQGATQGSPGMVMDARPQPVVIVGWETPARPLPVTVQQPLAVTLRGAPEQPLPVTLRGAPEQPLPVTLTGIRAGAEWDEIRIKAEPSITRRPGAP